MNSTRVIGVAAIVASIAIIGFSLYSARKDDGVLRSADTYVDTPIDTSIDEVRVPKPEQATTEVILGNGGLAKIQLESTKFRKRFSLREAHIGSIEFVAGEFDPEMAALRRQAKDPTGRAHFIEAVEANSPLAAAVFLDSWRACDRAGVAQTSQEDLLEQFDRGEHPASAYVDRRGFADNIAKQFAECSSFSAPLRELAKQVITAESPTNRHVGVLKAVVRNRSQFKPSELLASSDELWVRGHVAGLTGLHKYYSAIESPSGDEAQLALAYGLAEAAINFALYDGLDQSGVELVQQKLVEQQAGLMRSADPSLVTRSLLMAEAMIEGNPKCCIF
ncbi:MAG: hypothetical protein AAGH76_14280 [Pseudomonadota bacterium]